MRWLLYGDLGERHVVESFEAALREAGHDVASLPSLVATTGPLDTDPARERERARLIDAALPADVVFVFRVDELTPRQVHRLRSRGAFTIGWLCDDPLYYEATYRHVVEAYDLTLHTAHEDLLHFYAERHGIRGYAFPYWTDDAHYPYVYDPEAADVEIGFVGSFGGQARRMWRYDLMASLPFDARFYGPTTKGLEDYASMGLGLLRHEEIPRMLHRFRVALNLAQSFDEQATDRWSFPELPRFREFFFPSRLVAYAAAGVPTLSLQRPGAPAPLASVVTATTRADLIDAARELLSGRQRLLAASRAAREEFEACLTARSRVRMLEAILADRRDRPLEEHATMWRSFGERPAPPRPGITSGAPVRPRDDLLREAEISTVARADARTILLIGRGGRMERQLGRGARNLGHDVALIELDDAPDLAPGIAATPRGYGPLEIGAATLGRLRERSDADVAVFVDGCAPDEAAAASFRAAGVPLVCLRLADPSFLVDTVTYLDRFDAVATTSDEAAAAYRSKGPASVVVIEPGAEPLSTALSLSGVALAGGQTGPGVAIASRLERAVEIRDDAPVLAILPDAVAAEAEASAAVAAGVVPIAPENPAPGLTRDREVLAYRDPAQLLGLAGYYARRPEELEAIRTAGLARVLAERRWAYRWPSVLAAVPRRRRSPPQPRIVVLGYFGMENLGDDLILDVISAQIGDQVGAPNGARLQVLGYAPGAVAARHHLAGAHLLDPDSTEDLIRDADLLVIGSGGLLHDRELVAGAALDDVFAETAKAGIGGVVARSAAVAAAHGTPVALLALGVGPITSDPGRALVRFVAQRTSSISVRDRSSLDVLRTCGVTREMVLAADPTLLVEPPDPEPARAWLTARGIGSYVTVAMRRWPEAPADLADRVAAVLDGLVAGTGVHVVFVPFQRNAEGKRDEAANRAVAERMTRADAAVLLDEEDREVVFGIVAGARAGIAMRLHASILANAFGVPTLGLAYDPKVRAHHREIGREDLAFRLDASSDAMLRSALDLVRRRDHHVAALAPAIAAMRERVALAFDAVAPLVRIDPERRRRSRRERDAGLDALRRELTRG